jgi:two-component system C4-dicarboxylate transport response regulator DctD
MYPHPSKRSSTRLADPDPEATSEAFATASPTMRRALLRLEAYAQHPTHSLLIEGERGTGKSLLAKWAHERSPRRHRPCGFVEFAQLPTELAQSELFGHTQGAFTNATHARAGLILSCAGGSMVLDDIGAAPPALQPLLLGWVERQRIRASGSDVEVPIDVRLIATSNQPVRELVGEGLFRADVADRLSRLLVRIPALRERPEDIAALVHRFVCDEYRRLDREPPAVEPDLIAFLARQKLPGNIRDLETVCARLAMLHPDAAELRLSMTEPSALGDCLTFDHRRLDDVAALYRSHGGNVSAVARHLDVARETVRISLERSNVDPRRSKKRRTDWQVEPPERTDLPDCDADESGTDPDKAL